MSDRLEILNIWVDPVTREEAKERVESFLTQGDRPHSVFAANPEKNFSVPQDLELYECYRSADLLLPDGIGIVKAANWLYGAGIQRVPGSEFIFDICRLAVNKQYGVFIYGAKEEVNNRSVTLLKDRFPGLKIVGRSNGYVPEEKMADLVNEMNESGAEILLIALGSPRQEKWFTAWKHQLKNIRVVQGIGGTLDTIGGDVKRAPSRWCRLNMEWLYRLLHEPKRIKRQKLLPVFVFLVLKELAMTKLHLRRRQTRHIGEKTGNS